MSQREWLRLRDWLRQVFGPAEGAEMFNAHVFEAREINQPGPRELGPGF